MCSTHFHFYSDIICSQINMMVCMNEVPMTSYISFSTKILIMLSIIFSYSSPSNCSGGGDGSGANDNYFGHCSKKAEK